jgi:hypothetical protein
VIAGGLAKICLGETIMVHDEKRVFDGLLDDYAAFDESANTIVRQLKKRANAELRRKLVQELRNFEKKRLDLLDQMDSLAKSI